MFPDTDLTVCVNTDICAHLLPLPEGFRRALPHIPLVIYVSLCVNLSMWTLFCYSGTHEGGSRVGGGERY